MQFEYYDNTWKPLYNDGIKQSISIPQKIDRYRIEVSLCCDLNCKYCVVHMNNVQQQNTIMSLDTAKNIVNKFNAEVGSNGSVFIIGGEPLTNIPVTKYIIENIKGSSVIFTNALKLSDDLIDFFKHYNTYILTSFDGYSIEQNESRFWPNVAENYNKVLKNITRAVNKGCKVGVSCLLHDGNLGEAKKIASFFTETIGAKSMSFAYPHLTVIDSPENHFDFSKYTKDMKDLYDLSKEKGIYIDQIGKIVYSIIYSKPFIIGCRAGTTQRAYYPNGEETICTKIDTLSSWDFKEYIEKLPAFSNDCKKCNAYLLCSGECPWDFAVSQLSNKGHNRICDFRSSLVEYIIKDIVNDLNATEDEEEAKRLINSVFVPMTNNYCNNILRE